MSKKKDNNLSDYEKLRQKNILEQKQKFLEIMKTMSGSIKPTAAPKKLGKPIGNFRRKMQKRKSYTTRSISRRDSSGLESRIKNDNMKKKNRKTKSLSNFILVRDDQCLTCGVSIQMRTSYNRKQSLKQCWTILPIASRSRSTNAN
jgi:hypothetical protein